MTVCLYHRVQYLYIALVFLLLSLCVGLFAAKTFWGKQLWGPEITLVLTVANIAVIATGGLLSAFAKKRYALALLEIAAIHLLVLLGSLGVQGKVNDPTLYALLLCSLQLAILAYLRLDRLELAPEQRSLLRGERWLLDSKFLGYGAIVFFGIAYYLLLAKADLTYPPLAFQYLALALLSLALAVVF